MSTAPSEVCPGLDSLTPEYEILGELGRGGMAVVYLARERQLERDVAIKLIRARWVDDAQVLARFAREARLVAWLEHPNIVRLYSVRHLPGAALALVMQYVPGVTLKEEVLRTGPLASERAERVLREVAAALACAHDRGIVHRDVKPDNIFIDERDRTALLADFGVARPLSPDAQLTVGGMAMGTPAYMAPEQIDGSGLDARTDVYSLGLVGWEMLAGETPWEGESFYSVLHKQKTSELPSLRKLRPDVPARLRTAIEVAIRKRPDDRWSDVGEFLACLDGKPEPDWRAWFRSAADRLTSLAAAPAAPESLASVVEPDAAAVRATVVYPRPGSPPDAAAAAAPAHAADAAGVDDAAQQRVPEQDVQPTVPEDAERLPVPQHAERLPVPGAAAHPSQPDDPTRRSAPNAAARLAVTGDAARLPLREHPLHLPVPDDAARPGAPDQAARALKARTGTQRSRSAEPVLGPVLEPVRRALNRLSAAAVPTAGSAGAAPLPSLESWRAWLRLPELLGRFADGGPRIVLRLAGEPRAALVSAADLELLRGEQRRLAAERARLQEWQELRAMLDRRTVADAAHQRHSRWRLYPRGAADHATLLDLPGVDASLATLLMATYGSLDVLLGDVPAGVERRTGGRISAARARELLGQLRIEERGTRNEE